MLLFSFPPFGTVLLQRGSPSDVTDDVTASNNWVRITARSPIYIPAQGPVLPDWATYCKLGYFWPRVATFFWELLLPTNWATFQSGNFGLLLGYFSQKLLFFAIVVSYQRGYFQEILLISPNCLLKSDQNA